MITVLQSNQTRDTTFYGHDDICSVEKVIGMVFDSLEDEGLGYSHVGSIDTNDLDEAYQLTNNINSSWIDGDKVDFLSDAVKAKGGCRSTSVGDILIDNSTGKIWIVASFGFDDLLKVAKEAKGNA